METEIRKKIPEVALKQGIEPGALARAWEEYQGLVDFRDDVQLPADFEIPEGWDPKDVPYLLLHEQLGHMIYTDDPHLEAMGAVTVRATVFVRLKRYSRSAAVEFSLAVGGVLLTNLTVDRIAAALTAVKQLLAGFQRLSTWAQYLIVALVIAAFIHPTSRAAIQSFVQKMKPAAKKAGLTLLEGLAPLIEEYDLARDRAAEALQAATAEMGSEK